MRALLSFFTILPLGAYSLEEAARRAYLLPAVGVLTGVPAALLLLWGSLPDALAAILVLALCLLASGLHHADGVLDAGDALMVRGDARRRREVLVDKRVGIGGLFALFVVYGPALAALSTLAASPAFAALALLAAEAAARSAMVLLMAFGRPATDRSSAVPFVKALRGPRRVAGVVLALVVPAVILLPLGVGPAFVGVLVPTAALVLLVPSGRAFGGITGDLVGASSEATRTVMLVVLATI